MAMVHLESRAFGEANEQNIKSKLEQFLGCTLFKSNDPFAVIDFSNTEQNQWVEVKRRRCNRNRYDTVILGKNKVDYVRANGGDALFVWTYDDGDYYINYNQAQFDTFEVAPFQRRDREGDVESLVYHIPTALLTRLL